MAGSGLPADCVDLGRSHAEPLPQAVFEARVLLTAAAAAWGYAGTSRDGVGWARAAHLARYTHPKLPPPM